MTSLWKCLFLLFISIYFFRNNQLEQKYPTISTIIGEINKAFSTDPKNKNINWMF